MQIRRIRHLNALLAAQIAILCAKLPDLRLDKYIEYLYTIASDKDTGLFGAWDDKGNLVAFVQNELPCDYMPGIGWMHIACAEPTVPRKTMDDLCETINTWFRDNGATEWKSITEHSPRACERLYGAKMTNEKVLQRTL